MRQQAFGPTARGYRDVKPCPLSGFQPQIHNPGLTSGLALFDKPSNSLPNSMPSAIIHGSNTLLGGWWGKSSRPVDSRLGDCILLDADRAKQGSRGVRTLNLEKEILAVRTAVLHSLLSEIVWGNQHLVTWRK